MEIALWLLGWTCLIVAVVLSLLSAGLMMLLIVLSIWKAYIDAYPPPLPPEPEPPPGACPECRGKGRWMRKTSMDSRQWLIETGVCPACDGSKMAKGGGAC